jgi:hypothetical protein
MPAVLDLKPSSFGDESIEKLPFEPDLPHELINAFVLGCELKNFQESTKLPARIKLPALEKIGHSFRNALLRVADVAIALCSYAWISFMIYSFTGSPSNSPTTVSFSVLSAPKKTRSTA